jgi:hypothetical protein
MLTRRIVASACALCLAVPTFAAAKPVHHHAVPVVVTGDTKDDLHADQQTIVGDTKGDLPRAMTQANEQAIVGDTKGDLPRAITHAPPATKRVSLPRGGTVNRTVAGDGSTDGWQIAALAEAGLLAALAIGAGVSVAGRRHRAPRMGV